MAHTLEVYSRLTFDYPYPVAYSVHTDRIGMEYPMMAFNGGRPQKDGTYELLNDLWQDAIKATPGSEYIHIGTDESYELGKGVECGCQAEMERDGA